MFSSGALPLRPALRPARIFLKTDSPDSAELWVQYLVLRRLLLGREPASLTARALHQELVPLAAKNRASQQPMLGHSTQPSIGSVLTITNPPGPLVELQPCLLTLS
ncbi:hypothetical protein MAPG_06221 [Magnaporthiopsis poae ATCC 64411]|uniref:Uncharacterized protein n=1 Tax=Magnaporthiopsis poae (strain ATCC 64411 / 73-15) TaxID=644358 RepID=A0A0C4E1G0_MAGP6|nr:hypothetical protein MAPG_06221 [Magnaporthiopsis poae ATCC 64411]